MHPKMVLWYDRFKAERIAAETSMNKRLEEKGFIFKQDSIVCRMCGFKTRKTLAIDHVQFMHKLFNRECVMVAYKPEKYEQYAKAKICVKMYSYTSKLIRETEELMLYTFSSWPKRLPLGETLVDAGFYYTGNSDEVRCIECKVLLYDWQSTDDPWIEHEKASPNCLLVKIHKKGDNML